MAEELDGLCVRENHKQQCTQQCTLNEGLKKCGKRGEMTQSHNRACFEPINVEDVTPEEKRQAQMALTHLTEKRDKSIKGQTVE